MVLRRLLGQGVDQLVCKIGVGGEVWMRFEDRMRSAL